MREDVEAQVSRYLDTVEEMLIAQPGTQLPDPNEFISDPEVSTPFTVDVVASPNHAKTMSCPDGGDPWCSWRKVGDEYVLVCRC